MKLTKTSSISNRTHTLDIPDLDEEQYLTWLSEPRGTRALVQDAFPHLNADEREFIITGITAEEWEGLFKDFHDEEDKVDQQYAKEEERND